MLRYSRSVTWSRGRKLVEAADAFQTRFEIWGRLLLMATTYSDLSHETCREVVGPPKRESRS